LSFCCCYFRYSPNRDDGRYLVAFDPQRHHARRMSASAKEPNSVFACPPAGFSGEPLEGTKGVRPINGMFLYYIGSLQRLFDMADGVSIQAYDLLFKQSTEALAKFLNVEYNATGLPESCKQAIDLGNYLQCLRVAVANDAKARTLQVTPQ